MTDKKPKLPFGWIVKQSKSYPDKVYYFNVNTGDSTWEFPDLLLPALKGQSADPTSPILLTSTSINPRDILSPTESLNTDKRATTVLDSLNKSRNTPLSKSHQSPETPASGDTMGNKCSHPRISKMGSKVSSGCADVGNNSCVGADSSNLTGHTAVLNQRKCHGESKAATETLARKDNLPRDHARVVLPDGGKVSKDNIKSNTMKLTRGKRGMKTQVVSTDSQTQVLRDVKQNDGYAMDSKLSQKDNFHVVLPDKRSTNKDSDSRLVSVKSQTSKSRQVDVVILDDSHSKKYSGTKSPGLRQSGKPAASPLIRNKNNSSESPVTDLRQSLKRKDSDVCILSGSDDLRQESAKRQKTNSGKHKAVDSVKDSKLTGTEVSHRHVIQNSPDVIYVDKLSTSSDADTRRIVKVLHQEQAEKRSIQLKTDHNSNIRLLSKGNKRKSLETDLTISTHYTDSLKQLTPGPQKSEYHHVDSGSEENCSTNKDSDRKVKLYIGNTDKLLSIQSWIDNLQEGSDSPAREFYRNMAKDEKALVSMNRSTDSGYTSTVSPQIRTERGWPGKLKPSNLDDREIVEMEVDSYELPEEDMEIDLVLMEVRQEVKANPNKVKLDICLPESSVIKIKQRVLIVVDTNIMISNLKFLEELRDEEIKGIGLPVLYIPWIVLQELDNLKDRYNTSRHEATTTQVRARKAVNFLSNHFSKKHPRVVGQSPKEADTAAKEFSASCNDDSILQACLYCQKQYTATHVVLLTNDKNLINKALVSTVKAFTRNEIMKGLKTLSRYKYSSTKSQTSSASPFSCEKTFGHNSSQQPESSSTVQSVQGKIDSSKNPIEQKQVNTSTSLLGFTQDISKVNANNNQSDQIPQTVEHSQVQLSLQQGVENRKPVSIPSPELTQTGCMADHLLQEEKQYTEEILVDEILCKLKKVLKEAFGKILEVEMKKAYDDIWLDIVYRKPPWSLQDILECWKKHWMAVFGMVFDRRLENKVESLQTELHMIKAPSMKNLVHICDDSLPFLSQCVGKSLYGETMSDIVSCVQALQGLGRDIDVGLISVQSISSLDAYLKSKLVHPRGDDHQSITSLSSKPYHQPTSTCSNPSLGSRNQSKLIQACAQSPVKNGSEIDVNDCEPVPQELSSDKESHSLSPETAAGELLQKIWQLIYKYCDHIYQALNDTITTQVSQEIEAVLQKLVPAAKQLRILFTGLLEMPLEDLPHLEDKFTDLCNHCNNFFSLMGDQENVPEVPVLPAQFLILYSVPHHRETLYQFHVHLDKMLQHLYGCLNILYPDD